MTSDQHDGNPQYPSLPLTRHRKLAAKAGSVAAMDKAARIEYGKAVSAAFRALQRKELLGTKREPVPANCASGTFHSEGADIAKAVLKQQRAAFARAIEADRANRTDAEITSAYDAVMERKARTVVDQLISAIACLEEHGADDAAELAGRAMRYDNAFAGLMEGEAS